MASRMGTSASRRSDKGRPRTAFVLSGGGNQGVSQVGMLRALIDRDIIPTIVIGTSAGALNGAAVASAPAMESIDRLEEVWCSLRAGEVFPGSKLGRAWNILRRDDHLFTNDGLAGVIDRATLARTFEELEVPFRVVATDLDTGEEVVFARGPLKPALLASAALPGVYPPVEYDGRTLVDGAVVNTVPLWHALAGPIERVYVLNVSGSVADRPSRSPLDVVLRAFAISRAQRFELELRNVRPGVEVHVLPRPNDDREVFDFSGAETLIDEAHQLVGKYLEGDPLMQPNSKARRRWFRRATEVA